MTKCDSSGILCEHESSLKLLECKVVKNSEHGIDLRSRSRLDINNSRVCFNGGSAIYCEGDCRICGSGNVCIRSGNESAPPGFQFVTE